MLRKRTRRPGSPASATDLGLRGSPLRRTTLRARPDDVVSRRTIRGLDDGDRGVRDVVDRGAAGFDAVVRCVVTDVRGRSDAVARTLVDVAFADRPPCTGRAPAALVARAALEPARAALGRVRSVGRPDRASRPEPFVRAGSGVRAGPDVRAGSCLRADPVVRAGSGLRDGSVARRGSAVRPEDAVRGEAFRPDVPWVSGRDDAAGRAARGPRPLPSRDPPVPDRGVRGVEPDGVIAPPRGRAHRR